ncbi:hypothetical protein G5C01_00400 [Moraxella bovoculi]|nr:hypothetical protein [Moraxella bovoculi]NSM09853.1 hypothetical protein [Moraxella bovoculi]
MPHPSQNDDESDTPNNIAAITEDSTGVKYDATTIAVAFAFKIPKF